MVHPKNLNSVMIYNLNVTAYLADFDHTMKLNSGKGLSSSRNEKKQLKFWSAPHTEPLNNFR